MAVTSTTSDNTEVERGPKEIEVMDVERQVHAEVHLMNTTVQNITWRGVTVTVKDRETKLPKTIVENVEGIVEAGMSIRRFVLPRLIDRPLMHDNDTQARYAPSWALRDAAKLHC